MSKYTSLAQLTAEKKRLTLLRLLSEQAGYASNVSVLESALTAMHLPSTREETRELCDWLQERELVRVTEFDLGVVGVVATIKGVEAAQGKRVVAGVARPSPQ